jgi:hypothetical protein
VQEKTKKKPLQDYVTHQMQMSFITLLKELGLAKLKENVDSKNGSNNNSNNKSDYTRHTITLHTFRKAYKTAISLSGRSDLAEYMIGHRSLSQTYFRIPPKQIAKIYQEKLMPLLTFCDSPSLMKKVETLEEKTEIINGLQLQLNKQAAQIEQLQAEKEQDYVAHSVDDYSSEQYIEKQEKIIEHLKTQMHSQNTALIDATKNTKVVADNVLTQTRSEEKIVEMLEKKVDILMKKVEQLTADKQTDKKSS